jgi:acetoin utilization deacetylase AcuC-like enzyme
MANVWGEEEDLGDYGLTKLHDAAENGNLDVIKALIGVSNVKIDTEVKTIVVKQGSHIDVDDSADDSDDDDATGAKNNDIDDSADSDDDDDDDDDDEDFTFETADVDINGRDRWRLTPLYAALLGAQLPALELLLAKVPNINMTVEKSSLLHFTCAMGGLEKHIAFASKAIEILLKANCKILLSDELQRTPLHIAAMNGLTECANLLLNAVATNCDNLTTPLDLLKQTDRKGWTAVHTAVAFDRVDTLKFLLTKLTDTSTFLNIQDMHGRTSLHIARERGNAEIANILIENGCSSDVIDKRGRTADDAGMEYGFSKDGESSEKKAKTVVIYHGDYCKHLTCETIKRGAPEPPPENIQRVRVLCNEHNGLLRMSEFKNNVYFDEKPPLATEADVLRVHDFVYVQKLQRLCSRIIGPENTIAQLDPDTAVCKASFDVALRAAGGVIHAIDRVMKKEASNAFCVVRPPGHHAGPRGVVTCSNDPCGSHGFCLLNNVAIGAGYAKAVYRHSGIQRVAILDFDVHHGNGTEACLRNLVPTQLIVKKEIPAVGIMSIVTPSYKPWLDKHDPENIFFCSVHGFGKRDFGPGWFYPGSGETESFSSRGPEGTPRCYNFGIRHKDDQDALSKEWRDTWRNEVFPKLEEFQPDLILISAGFDAHRRDELNHGHVQLEEPDYEWFTQSIVRISNKCCPGRVVSVLEGGYRVHGHVVSPFGRAIAGHLRALSAPGTPNVTNELRQYEQQFEDKVDANRLQAIADKEKREELDFMRKVHEANARAAQLVASGADLKIPLKEDNNDNNNNNNDSNTGVTTSNVDVTTDDGGSSRPSRKRRRKEVDYIALEAQLKAQEKQQK